MIFLFKISIGFLIDIVFDREFMRFCVVNKKWFLLQMVGNGYLQRFILKDYFFIFKDFLVSWVFNFSIIDLVMLWYIWVY